MRGSHSRDEAEIISSLGSFPALLGIMKKWQQREREREKVFVRMCVCVRTLPASFVYNVTASSNKPKSQLIYLWSIITQLARLNDSEVM